MKKRMMALLLSVLMVAAFLTGCGASSMDAVTNEMAPQEMYDAGAGAANGVYSSSNSTVADSASTSSDQKLIKRVNMDVETEDLEVLLDQISEKLSQLGGYVEEQQLYNGSSYSSRRSRSANMTIRIPAEKLDGFVEQVKGVSNVVSYNESTENVTLSYVATESRMKALQTEETRLLELLSKAENMSDLLEIEERLTDVRYELEKTTSQLRVLQNQVDYATVKLYIEQVTVYTEVEPQTVWQRIASGFSANLKEIGKDLVDFFVWAVTYSPQLVVLALVIVLIIVLSKRSLKRREVDSVPFPKPENEEK